ncbi:stalk domain-containing protein [Paenibacillus sinopodophylli]|uniref:stalk domain-containing protein n=1 Tax=Paenibacillus sinopodophylli TaxID=1837342 RepID=UPI001FE2ED92|nr:stalk domain-containing protein [Paenibacillus sinopodophylli]
MNRTSFSTYKKISIFLAAFILLPVLWLGSIATAPEQASAASSTSEIKVTVNNKAVVFQDAKPVQMEGRVLVPLRAVLEGMGAKVDWNSKQQLVTVDYSKDTDKVIVYVEMTVGSPFVGRTLTTSNGAVSSKVVKVDVPTRMINNRVYIPLRASGEFLGYSVSWKENTLQAGLKQAGVTATTVSFPEYTLRGDLKEMQQEELEVFFLTNVVREKRGAKVPLGLDVSLSKVARVKSKDMNDNQYFDHTSPTYGSPFEMMDQFGIDYSAAGENIAYGYRTATLVTNGWEDSPGHLKNMLSSSFKYIGIGMNNYYWTQQFIG